MRTDKFTYAQVESALYEAMRTLIKKGKVQAEREGKALIDTTLSHLNEAYVHECLKPFTHPPKRSKGKLYIKNESGEEVEYQRGQAIADYHNSQVKSKLQKARMNGISEQLSKAMGFIVTLPKEYIQSVIPDITDAEYEYLVKKLEAEGHHQPFAKDEIYETSLKLKFSRHQWTDEEMAKAKEFLLASKDCVLDEMGIRKEDVLFWSLHFDESFPHIHCMALPTCEKTYDKDVFSGKKKKDGTYTLLHKKGDVDITYSIGKFYERGKDGEYTFFKNFHQNVVDRMGEKGFDASGLIQNVTSGKSFTPSQMNKEQREESVRNAMMVAALQKKLKEIEAEKAEAISQRDTANAEARLAIKERENAIAEAQACREEVKEALAEARALEEEKDEILGELASKEIALVEQIKKQQNFVERFKNFLETLTEKAIKYVLDKFVPLWKIAKEKAEKERVDEEATSSLVEVVTKEMEVFKEQAEVNPLEGVGATSFDRTNRTQVNAALSQIKKALVGTIFEDDVKFVTPQAVEMHPLMRHCFDIWFDEERETKLLAEVPVEERSFFMRPTNRAERFKEVFMEELESGVLENIYNEEERGEDLEK